MGKEKISQLAIVGWQSTSDPRIKRRHNGQLYARFTKNGLRIEQRLHETNLAAAKKAVDKIEDFLREGKGDLEIKSHFNKSLKQMPVNAVLVGELWNEFVAYRTEGNPLKKLKQWRPKTQKEYSAFWVRSFEPFWANKLPSEINEKTWKEFIAREQSRSKRGDQLNFENHVKYFTCFLNWLVETKRLLVAPTVWDPNWVEDEKEEDENYGVVFTTDQMTDMLSSEVCKGAFGCFIHCAALMGMRSSEITQIKKDRINIKAGVIKLRAADVKTGSKTGRGRTVPIHPLVKPLILEQMDSNLSAYLFPNRNDINRPMDPTGFYGRWDELKADCGIAEGTPHHLRHTYATRAFGDSTLNPVLVCKALGMSMQTAMRVYIHFTDEQLMTVANRFSYVTRGETK